MPCTRIKDGFVCYANMIEYKGWLIEFPGIGTPAMLDHETLEPVDYLDTPAAFWDAVREYQANNFKIGD